MSAGSFHMSLFESRAARLGRRRSENHANGRILVAGALDQIEGRAADPAFADHSDLANCGCSARSRGVDGSAGTAGDAAPATNFPR